MLLCWSRLLILFLLLLWAPFIRDHKAFLKWGNERGKLLLSTKWAISFYCGVTFLILKASQSLRLFLSLPHTWHLIAQGQWPLLFLDSRNNLTKGKKTEQNLLSKVDFLILATMSHIKLYLNVYGSLCQLYLNKVVLKKRKFTLKNPWSHDGVQCNAISRQ